MLAQGVLRRFVPPETTSAAGLRAPPSPSVASVPSPTAPTVTERGDADAADADVDDAALEAIAM
jgi:hypothetical protein